MDATTLLDRLQNLGLTVDADGADLVITPGSKVPTDLIPELKERKQELLARMGPDPPWPTCGPRACLCDTYDIQPRSSCETCHGTLCLHCGGCLRASLVWRRAETAALYQDISVNELLERLRKGAHWLQDQDQRHFDGDRGKAADDELFSKMWALWSDLELALRHVHGYGGCVFGEGRECPTDGPVRCSRCVLGDGHE